MLGITLTASASLGQTEGLITLIGMGLTMLIVAYYAKWKLVKNTHDFVIAGRKLGLGFGIAGLLSVWTWVIGILLPIGVTYKYGLSGLWWFTVPNGLSVVAVIPFAKKLRRLMPHGYTISEFVSVRYGGAKLARIVVVAGILFGAVQIVTVNLKGASLMVATIFGMNEGVVAAIASFVILCYIMLGGLWASMSTSTLMCLLIMVPSVLVTAAVVGQVGGLQVIWQAVESNGNGLLSITRPDAFQSFGLTFCLALITAMIAGQEFWQVAWGIREKELDKTFFWGGGSSNPASNSPYSLETIITAVIGAIITIFYLRAMYLVLTYASKTYGLDDQDLDEDDDQESTTDNMLGFGAFLLVVVSGFIIAAYGFGWGFLYLGPIICLLGPIVPIIAMELDIKRYKKILASKAVRQTIQEQISRDAINRN